MKSVIASCFHDRYEKHITLQLSPSTEIFNSVIKYDLEWNVFYYSLYTGLSIKPEWSMIPDITDMPEDEYFQLMTAWDFPVEMDLYEAVQNQCKLIGRLISRNIYPKGLIKIEY